MMHQPASVSLTRLTYILFGMSIALDGLNILGGIFLARRPSNDSAHIWAAANSYFFLVLIYFLFVIVAIAVYRPRSPLPLTSSGPAQTPSKVLRFVAFGLLAGILAFLISIPVLFPADSGVRFVAQAIYFPFSASVIVKLLWLFVAIPIVTEIFFKGIVFKALSEYLSLPAAIIVSSILFAHFWPFFNGLAGMILGVISAIAYSRSRSLVSPIIANITFTAAGGSFVMYRVLSRS